MAGHVFQHPRRYGNFGGSPDPTAAPVANSPATGTTGAVVATLPAAVGRLTHITGFSVGRSAGAGATVTVAGLAAGSLLFTSVAGAPLTVAFDPPLPASALNTVITVTSAADGTGVNVNVAAWGIQA